MMPLYVGTKLVHAEPMHKYNYCALRGWEVPKGEDPLEAGYLVEYVDGGPPNVPGYSSYVSWTPKAIFEDSYKPSGAMGFGQALELLRRGYAIQRAGWNGKGMFAYLVPGNAYPASTEVARTYFLDELVPYNGYMALKGADGRVSTWVPSNNDCLADDWIVLDTPALFELGAQRRRPDPGKGAPKPPGHNPVA